LGGYVKSKTLAEKAAWDFQKGLPDDKKFEIVTINPCLVEGPTLIPGGFTSANMLLRFFNGSMTEVSRSFCGIVDVRDVSKMHLEAIRRADAANQRFIAYAERITMMQWATWLHEEFVAKGYNIPTKEAGGVAE